MGPKRAGLAAPREAKRAKRGAEPKPSAVFEMDEYLTAVESINFDKLRVDKDRSHGQVCSHLCWSLSRVAFCCIALFFHLHVAVKIRGFWSFCCLFLCKV